MSTIAFNYDPDAQADVYLTRFDELLDLVGHAVAAQPDAARNGSRDVQDQRSVLFARHDLVEPRLSRPPTGRAAGRVVARRATLAASRVAGRRDRRPVRVDRRRASRWPSGWAEPQVDRRRQSDAAFPSRSARPGSTPLGCATTW